MRAIKKLRQASLAKSLAQMPILQTPAVLPVAARTGQVARSFAGFRPR
jgi:hypothetical protein